MRSCEQYRKNGRLVVRNRGKFWTIERPDESVLVFVYGSMPVCTRTYIGAMWLAEYFADKSLPHFNLPLGHGLRWVGSAPVGILNC